MATVTVHNGIDNSYLYIDYSFSVSGRNWTCTASLKLQMGPTYNFEAWTSTCGNAATLRKDGGTMPGGGRPLRNQNYTLAGPIQVGSGTYDAAGNAPSVKVTWAWNVNSSWGSYVCPHGTATLTGSPIGPDIQKPSSLGCTVNSVTWNSVNGTFSVGNWGNEPTGSSKYIAGRLFGSSGSARREEQASNTNSITRNITTSSVALDGGITVKGAGSYRLDTYASNSAGSSTTSMQNVYTPPAPLASLTYTQTQQSTNVSVSATITGADSGSNYGNTVTTYYRYSTNGGSSYSNWTSAGTGTAWTAKTVSFTAPYGSSVKIQAKQTYQSKDSTVKEVSFTATNGTAPSGGTVTVTGSTWNTVTLQASGANYGKPDGISTRGIIVGVTPEASSYSYKREVGLGAVTSGTGTVNNNSAHGGSAQPFDLKGMIPVYAYLWVNNTVQSAFVEHKSTPYYLPPAPGSASYTEDGNDEYTISYTGVVANNVTDYTASELTRTVRYKIGSGNWVYVENDTQKALDAVTSETIEILPAQSATVEAWMTYRGKNSTVSTFTISNSNDPVFLYGSVEGEATKIRHFYGSVNGETVKAVKIYASVDGVARKVFEDV